MLNPFPQLLTFTFFAPTLLRIAAAVVFLWLAQSHYKNREHIAHENFPVIGKAPWVAWAAALVTLIIGLGLFFGFWTQWAAILGVIASLKYAVWAGKYPSYFVLVRATALLLLVICLSLLITGAGAMAFDIPL